MADAESPPRATDRRVPAGLRREQMRAVIEGQAFVRVSELSERFRISEVTVRNDLAELAAAGSIRRLRGGAIGPKGHLERPYEETEEERAEEKRAMGRAAARLVASGHTVLLDAGTTVAAVARALVERDELHDVTVITNSLKVAVALEAAIPRFQVIITGGTLRPMQHSLVEPLAGKLLAGIHADLAILGCNGVDPEAGITNVNLPEAQIKELMLATARRRVVVADATKLGQVTLVRLCGVGDIDMLITDSSADPAVLAALRERGLTVDLAG